MQVCSRACASAIAPVRMGSCLPPEIHTKTNVYFILFWTPTKTGLKVKTRFALEPVRVNPFKSMCVSHRGGTNGILPTPCNGHDNKWKAEPKRVNPNPKQNCCNVERTKGRFPKSTTISADSGPVGKTPFCPFHIATNQEFESRASASAAVRMG